MPTTFNAKYIPPAFLLTESKSSSLFSFILYYIIFHNNESPEDMSHEINYDSDDVQAFLKRLEEALPFAELNCEKSTIAISVLLGKLLLQELPYVPDESLVLKNIHQPNKLSFQNVAKTLQFGTRRYNSDHVILKKKRYALHRKEKKESLSLGFDTNDDNYASFCDNGEDPSFIEQVAHLFQLGDLDPPAETDASQEPTFTDDVLISRSNILYTLLYLVLFTDFDPQNASLLSVLEVWLQARAELNILRLYPKMHDRYDTLDFLDERDIQPPSDLPLPFIQFQTDFNLMSELDSLLTEIDQNAPFCASDALLYLKFRDMVRDPSNTNDILEQFLVLFKRPERNLINLFTFLDFILPKMYISHKENYEKVHELMICAKQQFMEPLPLGGLAKSILLKCKRKLLHSGSQQRDEFVSALQKTKLVTEGITENEPVFQRKTVHVLYNPHSQHASRLKEKMTLSSPDADDNTAVVHGMANLLLNIFEDQGMLDEELAVAPQLCLAKYFHSTYTFMKEVELGERSEEKGPLFLDNLKHTIMADAVEYGDEEAKPVERDRCPDPPQPHINFVELPSEVELEHCKMERRIFPRSCVVDALHDIIKQSELQNALTEDSKLEINIAIAGGSGTFQRLAHSMVVANRLRLDKPMGKGYSVNFKVYSIPLGVNNHLASWLEKNDPLFSRYWYMPMTSPLSVGKGIGTEVAELSRSPYQSQVFQKRSRSRKSFIYNPVHTYRGKEEGSEASKISDENSKPSPPKSIFNRLFNHYICEAKKSVPVHVYTAQCLCYDVSKRDLRNQNSTPTVQRGNSVVEYISLSFCQRLDIGIVAEAAQLIQKNDDFKDMDMEDVVSHKDFKFQGHALSVSYVPMDPSGLTPSSQIIEKPSVYHSICVKSTSTPGDSGPLASPEQPWLEVLSEDTSSQKRKSKLGEDNHIANSHHVAQLIIDSTTAAKFNILMDGEVYGPYHKIIIARDNKVRKFDMMTFGVPKVNV